MRKVIRDGKVAVLYSPGFGAGWYTWAGRGQTEQMVFSPELVALVEANKREELEPAAERLFPGQYAGGVYNLKIEWIPEGTHFAIDEYDGSESIRYLDSINLVA